MDSEHFDDEVIALCERRGLAPRRMLAVLAIFAGYTDEAVHQLRQTLADAACPSPSDPAAWIAPAQPDTIPKPPGPRPETPPRLDPGREARLQSVRKPAPKPDTGGRGQRECVVCGELKGHTAFNVGSLTCRKCNGKS